MSGDTRNGKCAQCGIQRFKHDADDVGLRLLCPDGSGRRFMWAKANGRASGSFSAEEIRVLDAVVAQAMGSSNTVSRTSPVLVALRRKTLTMKAKSEEGSSGQNQAR